MPPKIEYRESISEVLAANMFTLEVAAEAFFILSG